jgi:hypothetical protein
MGALPSSLAKTKPKYNKNATATQAKKETTVVACPTTVLVVIDMVLCSATFVVFGKLIKRIVVVPI